MKFKLGIDCIDEHLDLFEEKRIGLITNPTGINSKYQSTIDVLNEKTNLVALFSPEYLDNEGNGVKHSLRDKIVSYEVKAAIKDNQKHINIKQKSKSY